MMGARGRSPHAGAWGRSPRLRGRGAQPTAGAEWGQEPPTWSRYKNDSERSPAGAPASGQQAPHPETHDKRRGCRKAAGDTDARREVPSVARQDTSARRAAKLTKKGATDTRGASVERSHRGAPAGNRIAGACDNDQGEVVSRGETEDRAERDEKTTPAGLAGAIAPKGRVPAESPTRAESGH